jgi:hypothetical protein
MAVVMAAQVEGKPQEGSGENRRSDGLGKVGGRVVLHRIASRDWRKDWIVSISRRPVAGL